MNDNNTAFSALDFALELKKNSVSDKTFIDYKHRISKFKKYLKDRYLNDLPIKNITKKNINEFLNSVLVNSSSRNRNNTLSVLNAIFSTLEENELIEYNVVSKIKKIQAKPERNKTYTQTQQDEIFTLMEQKDRDLGLYSFRHTFITKLYRQLRTTYTQGETYDRLMLITGHTTLSALQQYLRDIDAELPEDYSHLLE